MLHSLLCTGKLIHVNDMLNQLNQLLDPESTLHVLGGCVCEIIEIIKDEKQAYIVTFNAITPRLASLYQHLYHDDARIVLREECYNVQLADKYKHQYSKPTIWATPALYNVNYKIIYKCGPLIWDCELLENLI
jgi:hypothetical protein